MTPYLLTPSSVVVDPDEPRMVSICRACPFRAFIYCDTVPTVLADLPVGGLLMVNDRQITTDDLPLVIEEGDLFSWVPGAEA